MVGNRRFLTSGFMIHVGMSELLPELHHEEKTRRCPFYPVRHVNRIRRMVERTVDLDRIKEPPVVLQLVLGAQRIEKAFPCAFASGI